MLIHRHLWSIVPKNVCACGLSVCVHHPMLYRGGLEREGGSEIEFARNCRHTLSAAHVHNLAFVPNKLSHHSSKPPPLLDLALSASMRSKDKIDNLLTLDEPPLAKNCAPPSAPHQPPPPSPAPTMPHTLLPTPSPHHCQAWPQPHPQSPEPLKLKRCLLATRWLGTCKDRCARHHTESSRY